MTRRSPFRWMTRILIPVAVLFVVFGAALPIVAYSRSGPLPGSTINGAGVTQCSILVYPTGVQHDVRELSGPQMQFARTAVPVNGVVRRWYKIETSADSGRTWATHATRYQDARISFPSVAGGNPAANFPGFYEPLTINRSPLVVRVSDYYELYQNGVRTWKSPAWIPQDQTRYSTMLYNGATVFGGISYYDDQCILAR